MLDFGDVTFNTDLDIAVQDMNFNFGSLITLNTNPYTFAASIVVDILVNLWSGAKERELLEQQIALLKEIDQKIDILNAKADQIIKMLSELPSILLPAIRQIVHDEVKMGRLDGYYVPLEHSRVGWNR